MRKTINVASIVEKCNMALACTDNTTAGRESICALVESVLFETGQYAGFRYLNFEAPAHDRRREYFMKGN